MKLEKYNILAIGLVSLGIGACTDLDTKPEGDIITSEQKEEIAEALPSRVASDVLGMFASIGKQGCVYGMTDPRDDDFGYPMAALCQDLNSADMVAPNNDFNWFSVASEYSDRTYNYANPYMRWSMFYTQIKQANDILSSIPEDTELAELKYYRGMALATRAFDYFSLVQNYQFTYVGNEDKPAVPIVTDKEAGNPSNNPRATVKAVYELIMSDLNQAVTLLEGYNRPAASKNFINQNVAYGLRARVNLVMQNWAAAADDATKALSGYSPASKGEISKPAFVDAQASANWMWAILLNPSNMPAAYPSWISTISSFSGDAYTAGVGCYKMISSMLYAKIGDKDVRKGWWVDENLKSKNLDGLSWAGYDGQSIPELEIPDVKQKFTPYTNVKFGVYQGNIGTTINSGDWCLMRAEEMILIQAEATAMAGNPGGGKKILEDFIKAYRDEEYTCSASSKEEVQDAVWLQRRIELWGEGFAFPDVMRLKKNIVRFNSNEVEKSNFPDAFKFNLKADDGWLLLRIPQKEINSNNGISESDNNKDGKMPVQGDGAGLTDGVTD